MIGLEMEIAEHCMDVILMSFMLNMNRYLHTGSSSASLWVVLVDLIEKQPAIALRFCSLWYLNILILGTANAYIHIFIALL